MKEKIISLFYFTGNLFLIFQKLKPAIIMYHRVLPDEQDQKESASLSISTTNFEKHLKFFKKNYNIVNLDEIHIKKNRKPNIVLTLDDGYLDNLEYALPLLEKYKVPATIYITTSFPENECNMWWYSLNDISENKKIFKLDFNNHKLYFDNKNEFNPKGCYKYFHKIFLTLNREDQILLINKLSEGLNIFDYNKITLNWEQIIYLHNHPLITLGAHTHTHGILKNQEEEVAKYDIKKSKDLLESKLGTNILHFCYPVGTLNDADQREYLMVKELNFKTATTTIYGLSSLSNSNYSLPRVATKKRTSPMHLKAKLKGWNSFFKGIQI